MSWWKQLLLGLLIVVAAAAVWYRFVPGATEIVAGWGLGRAPAEAAVSDDGATRSDGARRSGSGGTGSAVIARPVTNATINDRLTAIGTGKALHSVAVRPYTSGRLVEILARPGEPAEAGAVIARLDAEAEEIALDRAQLALDDAQNRLERINALRSSNTVTAVQQTEAELQVRNAALALRDAQLALERRQIVAPIGGMVGILPVSLGDYVTSSTDIAMLDDRSQLLVDFWVPEKYAQAITVGAPLVAESVARPGERYQGKVQAIDNQVDSTSRTLRIQGLIENPGDILRSGMAFQVEMRFEGESFPAVDPLSIQWGSDGAYVWVVRNGIAQRTPVRIIQRNADTVLVDGTFSNGDQVVTEGVHSVRDGQQVMVAGDEARNGNAGRGS
ncbi:efflux RND transporter periplasmic adaptor subunit [Nitratireductor luteus]|uniref:efflux RND transporter periplasmic adaptor subunit n=1 Tax=Nitratireductor luteus TaxID=2976980 RepID=UPI00223F8926|nr:efflux RND transporter periplasmic adaptor subunit [Nitratireductor luteus]